MWARGWGEEQSQVGGVGRVQETSRRAGPPAAQCSCPVCLSSGLSSVLPLPSWPSVFFFNCKHLLRSQASDRSRSLGAWC